MTWSHNDMWMLTADHGGYVKYWQSNMNNVKMFQAHKEAVREARFKSPTLCSSGPQATWGHCLLLIVVLLFVICLLSPVSVLNKDIIPVNWASPWFGSDRINKVLTVINK